LFFDQLLANYLTQLTTVPVRIDTAEQISHTYFTNMLTNAPMLQNLLRFKTGPESISALGAEGSILAFPASRKPIQGPIDNSTLKSPDLPSHLFQYATERDQAVNLLREDLLHGDYEPVVVEGNNQCFFFYLITSSPDFVLISKSLYKMPKKLPMQQPR
jgi:hypothetical protein